MSSFYTLVQWENGSGGASATIELDPKHPIFDGHFPGMPVLPGACMVQLTHDFVDKWLEKKTVFKKANQIKFLQMVNPSVNPQLLSTLEVVVINELELKVDHKLFIGEVAVFKFSGYFQINPVQN